MTQPRHFYEFGSFRLDATQRLLLRDGAVVPLTLKAFDLLITLVESDGQVLTKDELMRKVWPDSFVEEANLSHHIHKLREALGEREQGDKYIETLARRGYRFVAKVTEVQNEGVDLLVEEHSRAHIVIEDDETPDKVIETEIVPAGQRVVLPAPARRREPGTPFLLIGGSVVIVGLVVGLIYFLRVREPRPVSGPPLRSIAVLPFKPLTASDRDESLEMGMADTLITRLSNISQVIVRPTSSVRKYSNPNQDSFAAGKELMVDAVLDGNVQRAGDQLRVTVRLLRVSDGTTIWVNKFDTKFTDIFAVQDSISERVAAALSPTLTGSQKKGLSKRYTDNVEAYALYNKGRLLWSTFKQEDLLASINYFNAAIEKDPNYALAYCGLANAYNVISIYGPLSALEAQPKARQATLKALSLDDDLAEAHTALGGSKLFYEWDWPGAEKELLRAQELNPNFADAHTLYGYYLAAMGKPDEALAEQRRAQELAPDWSIPNHDVLLSLFEARRYDEAIEQSTQILKLEPNDYFAHDVRGQCYIQQGRYEEAKVELDRGDTTSQQSHPRALTELGHLYAVTGKKGEALKIAGQLQAKPYSFTPFEVAEIYVGLDDKAQAFAWLDKAYDQRSPFLFKIRVTPQFDALRSDSRYTALLQRMNLSP